MMKCVASLMALFTAALVGCGGGSSPASTPTQPTTSASPPPAQLGISTRCLEPFHPGQSGLCVAEVWDATRPQENNFQVGADLRIFGGPANAGFPRCPACGGPPWTWDLDVRIPSDSTPGVKTFAVWATDPAGRRVDTTASLQIVQQ